MAKYVVRSGSMRALGVFNPGRDDSYQRGLKVIVRTDRGLEAGEVLCEATEQAMAELKPAGYGQILRRLSGDDAREISRLHDQERREFEVCRKLIAEQQLDMRLVDVEHLFGGERVVIYYLSENRVDFRELVRQLAAEFQTRVEMRQIGVRDEAKLLADYGDCGKPVCCNTHLSEMPPVSMKMAKLLADYGDCGKPVCCNTHLSEMPPVSMKMAKLQKATLDPTKISGRCGRLKCCLRYEYDTYEALQKELPPIGSDVLTSRGRMRVLAHEILSGQLLVQTEDHRRVLVEASEVLTVIKRGAGGDHHSADRDSGDRSSGDRDAADHRISDPSAADESDQTAAGPSAGPADPPDAPPQ